MEPLVNIKKNKGLVFPLENYKEGQAAYYVKKHAFPGEYLFAFLKIKIILSDKTCTLRVR